MIKQSLITIATLALLNISAFAADTNDTKAEANTTQQVEDNSTKKAEDNSTKKAEAKPAVEVNTTACAGCHGANFEKKALNVSKIVKDMKKADIVASLKGYKEGKGGAMKALMLAQVKTLTDEQMTAIAEKFGK